MYFLLFRDLHHWRRTQRAGNSIFFLPFYVKKMTPPPPPPAPTTTLSRMATTTSLMKSRLLAQIGRFFATRFSGLEVHPAVGYNSKREQAIRLLLPESGQVRDKEGTDRMSNGRNRKGLGRVQKFKGGYKRWGVSNGFSEKSGTVPPQFRLT